MYHFLTVRYVIDILDLQEAIEEDEALARVTDKMFKTTKQKTGFGYKQFFICKNCSSRRTKLYILSNDKIYCRSCSPINIYKGIQNSPEGASEELTYRMDRIARENNISYSRGFDYRLIKRPKYMRRTKFQRVLLKLQILQNMRSKSHYVAILGIKPRRYDSKTINKIINSRYILFSDIEYIRKYDIDWQLVYNRIERLERLDRQQ